MTDASKRNQFSEQGYVIVRGLLTPEELHALREDTDRAVQAKEPPILFDDETPQASAAVPERYKSADGKVFRRLNRVIERGGAWERIVSGPLARAVAEILPPPLQVCLNRHNMVMLKAPYNPAPVPWHQDSGIWNEGTCEHVSAIVALDDFLPDNGCLEVVPGSHKQGPLAFGSENVPAVQRECAPMIAQDAVKVDLKAGDALLFHGLLLHGSAGNNTPATRRSMTIAFYSGDLTQDSTQTGAAAPLVREVMPACTA